MTKREKQIQSKVNNEAWKTNSITNL